MAYVQEEAQKIVTEAVAEMIEFDFTSIGGSGSVYITNSAERVLVNGVVTDRPTIWDGNTYSRVDISAGGFRNDLTGQPNEPTLRIAAYDLWQIPEWASATSGMELQDYYGIIVLRQRLFYNTPTLVIPQRFYIKQVESLTATEITFNLSGSFDMENIYRPSARKLGA